MRIYISHARGTAASELVGQLKVALATAGHKVVNEEPWGFRPNPVEGALASVDCVIVLLADPRHFVIFDTGFAVGAGKAVLVVTTPGVELPGAFAYLPLITWTADAAATSLEVLEWVQQVERERAERSIRQAHVPRVLDLYLDSPAAFEQVSPEQFEKALHDLLTSLGYEPSPIDHDHGADSGFDFELRRYPGYRKALVEVKKYSSSSKVPVGVVQQLLGVLYANRADCGILISSSGFTASSLEFAKRCGARIELWGMEEVLSHTDAMQAKAAVAG